MNIAGIIILRSCLEIFISIVSKKKFRTLNEEIDEIFSSLPITSELNIFKVCEKEKELKDFLTKIRKIANDVTHINKDDMENMTKHYDGLSFLKLFCILLENSILKDEIAEKIKSLNFINR